MTFIPPRYVELFKRSDFSVLVLTLLFGQLATSFLLISLVSSIFSQTRSNFSVSFIVLSLAIPAFFLMAFAGVVADLFDRKRVIIVANAILVFVVLLLLLLTEHSNLSIVLAFVYFGVNSFFLPAISAASAQLVRKSQLLTANSVFIFTLYGGPIIGTFIAAVVNFFFGHLVSLLIAETLLVVAFIIPLALPEMKPTRVKSATFKSTVFNIILGFSYVFKNRSSWFFFLVFAFVNGLIAFGTTLTPGFFDEVFRMPINRSPLFILPFVGFGVFLGALFLRGEKIEQSLVSALGILSVGLAALFLGTILVLGNLTYFAIVLLATVFLAVTGFGVVVAMIASRTELQKNVNHKFQGTVFGANTVLATLLAAILSPLAAYLEQWIGYIRILILGGSVLVFTSLVMAALGRKWKF